MKNRVGFVAAGASLLLAVGCGTATTNSASNQSSNSVSGSTSGKQITVGFVPGSTTDPFFISMEVGAEQEAKKLGVTLDWQGASQYSPSDQTPYINAMVTKKVTVLITCPTDATAMQPPIQQAVQAGIPVITADSTISNTSLLSSRITSNNTQGGAAAADYLAQAANGKKGVVAVLDPSPGITTDAARVQGFAQEIKKYPNLTYVGVQYDNEQTTKAATLAQNLLLRYPDLVGIFGTDDTSASGGAEGVRSAGKLGAVKIVGYDAEPAEIQDLQSGLISALIAQKPMLEGQMAVQYAYDLATGKKSEVKSFVQLDNVIITKDNLAKNQEWVYKSSAN
ncbi:substrate-binding domain-containing protein [Alicyclobacillus cycloheptanicus]|uniref:Ribose transport system substrate-binding protein n=1 Tax=Alicyclobacillus cycloheptanicus TaxID=1457 RepID=A0ABT9XHV8_9BACL|nr:ABC transporter substrate-binding protein [Alicyclobacillus cycloheptanicus]MDQ0189899.1 ribose transport system substrate-binding protein [Alicyclobacillus cycloheptanicus]WDM02197.1 substrate-binding domain-containing protein [Alicyclobacillus cycloheptanicus]